MHTRLWIGMWIETPVPFPWAQFVAPVIANLFRGHAKDTMY